MRYFPIRRLHSGALLLALTMSFLTGCAQQQQQQQQRFDSPQNAADSLVATMRDGSNTKLEHVLGATADDVLFSGDDVADHNAFQKFLNAYDEKHQLVSD